MELTSRHDQRANKNIILSPVFYVYKEYCVLPFHYVTWEFSEIKNTTNAHYIGPWRTKIYVYTEELQEN
jgi:hypothetical protein